MNFRLLAERIEIILSSFYDETLNEALDAS